MIDSIKHFTDNWQDFQPPWLELCDFQESQAYIKNTLLPFLDMTYQTVKNSLKGTSRKYAYSIRKSLIDLLEGNEEIKLVRYEITNTEDCCIYSELHLMMQCLNTIYFSIASMRQKLQLPSMDKTSDNIMRRILGDIKLLEGEILGQVELCKPF